tara:strand:+ start:3903 stop:4517 length:615 start_codon:yes stop_codon:yes gene_type:complete
MEINMGKQLLREYYALCDGGVCQDMLTEQEKKLMADGKKFFMTGCMQKFDTPNGNGRVYKKKILQREVENYWKLVKERRALGELDHPEDSVINLKNASHLVTDMWWDGEALMGKVEVLDTPSGSILKKLAQNGVTLGISSRGLGSTREERGNTIVEDDFQLICFDFVSEPSTPGAFMMKESKNPNIFTKADKINRIMNDILRDK